LTFSEALYSAAFLIAPARNDIRAEGLEPQMQYKGATKDRKKRGADNQEVHKKGKYGHTHTAIFAILLKF